MENVLYFANNIVPHTMNCVFIRTYTYRIYILDNLTICIASRDLIETPKS